MFNYDSYRHVKGESVFTDDFNLPHGSLHCAVFASEKAHGIIKRLDLTEASRMPGVRGIFTAKDIPGINQIGGVVLDEELLSEEKVKYIGEPIALVVAVNQSLAKKAVKKIKAEYEELEVITDPRKAFEKNELIIPPRIYNLGDTKSAFEKADIIVEGTVESGGQEHLYLETQIAISIPTEGGGIKIISSTQNPSAVQKVAARVLDIPANRIECEVLRLGGAFGGKEDQATAWAVLTALACHKLKKPVKLVLSRKDDMRMTGKRHPYSSDFKLGLTNEGKFVSYEVTFYQNSGAAADLSPAILDRTLAHCTNSYYIPNVKATGYCCRTNLVPNTAFRGFGGPQGMFVIESAIYKAAEKMGVEPMYLQEKNLLKEGDELPYGQKTESCNAIRCWNSAKQKFDFEKIKKDVEDFNNSNKLLKKGYAVMPICFGISFTFTTLNQASSLVHIYTDGSVSISTGAIEMGQGVNMKIRQVASNIFGINIDNIKTETTNTTRNANTSATAASSGADLNGKATEIACRDIKNRLLKVAAETLKSDPSELDIDNGFIILKNEKTDYTFNQMIIDAYKKRVSLSSHSFYATPEIHFNPETNKGKPFAYHVYGTAVITAIIDCLRGTAKIDSVKVVHDFGKSLNRIIDLSQAEGALLQGIGWMTLEEVLFDNKGKLLTDTLSTYKAPDIKFTPKQIQIEFLENSDNYNGLMNSKAIGEPPFMYGIASYFAILNAIKKFRAGKTFNIKAPMTNERILLLLYKDNI